MHLPPFSFGFDPINPARGSIAVHIEIDTSGQVGRAILCPPFFCQRIRSNFTTPARTE